MHHTAAARAKTAQAGAAREPNATPHSHVILNRVIPLVLRSPLHGLLSKNLMLLTYTGRKSGRRYTIPVSYFMPGDGEAIRVFSNQRWWRNLRGGASVTLRLRGSDVDAVAEVIEERETVAREVASFLAAKGAKAAPMINLPLTEKDAPTEARIAIASRDHVVIYISS